MNKKWIDKNGNFWDGISIVIDNMRVFNPSEEQLLAAGYTEYVEPEPTPAELLERAKQQKIGELMAYDHSNAVNGFDVTVNGVTLENQWLEPEKRANYKNSLDSAELLGMTEVHPVLGGQELTLSVTMAKTALAKIQIYADRCFGVTQQHMMAIQSLESVKDVEDYDFTEGYPERLSFNV